MKASRLMHYLQASMERWGDLDCYIDLDPTGEDIYQIEDVFCDMNADDDSEKSLVLCHYATRPILKAVE